jgi:hypothetical protein
MDGVYFTIQPNGVQTTEIRLTAPTLQELKDRVGGYIEIVPNFVTFKGIGGAIVPCVAFCDEEGLLKGLPFNWRASNDWKDALMRGKGQTSVALGVQPALHGNVLVVTGDKAFMGAL